MPPEPINLRGLAALLSSILVVLVSLGLPALFSLGKLSANVGALNTQMLTITKQVRQLAEKDMQHISDRLLILETRPISDEAEKRIEKIDRLLHKYINDGIRPKTPNNNKN